MFEIKNVRVNSLKNSKEYNFLSKIVPNQMEDIEQRKVQKAKIMNYSPTIWSLSTPTINHIMKLFDKNLDVFIKFKWDFTRDYPVNNKNLAGVSKALLNKDDMKIMKEIIFSIKNPEKTKTSRLKLKGKKIIIKIDVFPKIIRLSNEKYSYLSFTPKTPIKSFTTVNLELIKEDKEIYWSVSQQPEPQYLESKFCFN